MKRSYKKFLQRLGSNGLRTEIEKRVRTQRVTLQDLYEGPRTPPIVDARRAAYSWLSAAKKMGYNEIARLFDRHPGTVWKLVNSSKEKRT